MTYFALFIFGLWCFFFLVQVLWTVIEAAKIWRLAKRIEPINKKPFISQVLDFINLCAIMWYLLPILMYGEERNPENK